jgi:hypothetical protein
MTTDTGIATNGILPKPNYERPNPAPQSDPAADCNTKRTIKIGQGTPSPSREVDSSVCDFPATPISDNHIKWHSAKSATSVPRQKPPDGTHPTSPHTHRQEPHVHLGRRVVPPLFRPERRIRHIQPSLLTQSVEDRMGMRDVTGSWGRRGDVPISIDIEDRHWVKVGDVMKASRSRRMGNGSTMAIRACNQDRAGLLETVMLVGGLCSYMNRFVQVVIPSWTEGGAWFGECCGRILRRCGAVGGVDCERCHPAGR